MTAQTSHDFALAIKQNRKATDELLERLELHHGDCGKLAPDIRNIQRAVCDHFKLRRDILISDDHSIPVARPRQIGMYLARNLVRSSFQELSRSFGLQDHSTAIHACKRITSLCLSDWKVAYDVAHLEARLS